MPLSRTYTPATHHSRLGDEFYDVVKAADFPAHILRYRNDDVSPRIGLDTLDDAEWVRHFGYFDPLPGSLPRPLALRYHGHQFHAYNPDLGDGRGFLFAQLMDGVDGRLLDIGTKGSGTTPWSRGGDGRLTLKGGVREILASERLDALGVRTSRTLSVVETGENLHRGDEPSPTRSCVLARLSHSHIRIGTFQRLVAHDDRASIEHLVAYVIETYYPHLSDAADPAAALYDAATTRIAEMTAQWMAAGFVHGVLNTDNVNITGESFDYGPWRFLPHFDPDFTAAYFDHSGLYAYGRQPQAMMWNVARLGECLLPLSRIETIQSIFNDFQARYERFLDITVLNRLGLKEISRKSSTDLRESLFSFMDESQIGFEFPFFDWYGGPLSQKRATSGLHKDFYAQDSFRPLFDRIMLHEPVPGIDLSHPYFVGEAPAMMPVETVEAIWQPIATADDWSRLHTELARIASMKAALDTTPR
ncbi:YdiU family protein [Komagataeibacter melaceti]|uniref:Protein nucleotidyltransferase YdiU n=1 Tax=Komagataeibacter melaceti TaxID=2766577 RepID=A0A371YX67_9PROT|nr:YdiU family protein [Komagataeibacter melaceti]RFD18803.1 YdiU family protein [Komagataeibacter melaceti]